MNNRLYRSRDERIIAGVAGGVAEQYHMDPSLVRILWVILTPLTGGLALALYIIMAFVVPEEHAGDDRWAAWERQSGGYQWPDPAAGVVGGGAVAATSGGAEASAAAAGSPPSSGRVPPPASPTPGMVPPSPAPAHAPASPDDWRRAAHDARMEARGARRAARAQRWDGGGAVLFGLILIVVGGYFFARAYLPEIDVNATWPIVVVVLGAVLLLGSIRRGSDHSS